VRPRPGLISFFDVCRELAKALGDFSLGPLRHGMAFFKQRESLQEFLQLERLSKPQQPPPTATSTPPQHLVISCGDASGESHACRLVQEFKKANPGIRLEGFGGQKLQAQGVKIWEPLADLNVMGFKDVFKQLPLFLRCVFLFSRYLRSQQPDGILLVDYPGLHRHFIRIANRAKVPVVHYIAPQLWAWSPWRIRDFSRADALITILPFENDWYLKRGAKPVFVGHPLGDGLSNAAQEEAELPAEFSRSQTECWVGILPGSRRREIKENLPLLLQAAAALHHQNGRVRFVLPHLREPLFPLIEDILRTSPVEVLFAPGCFHRLIPELQAAWVTSGTAVLEVAAHQVPPVLVYRTTAIGAWLAKKWLSVPWIGGLNLMAGEELTPEFVGPQISPSALALSLSFLLEEENKATFLTKLAPLMPLFAEAGPASRIARILQPHWKSDKN
jgi:lipid-A-disaccharide synthase